jgi:hypothetical protein
MSFLCPLGPSQNFLALPFPILVCLDPFPNKKYFFRDYHDTVPVKTIFNYLMYYGYISVFKICAKILNGSSRKGYLGPGISMVRI